MARIGFIGLGNMGGPMAANLARAGHAVTAFDLNEEAVARALQAGCASASSLQGAVGTAEVVITMLPAGAHVQAVYGGEDGVLAHAPTGCLMIDCSTIDVETARLVAQSCRTGGWDMVDAPVSGGVGGAEAATLTFMVGGPDGAMERARPVLESMGKTIVHAGPAGNGQAAKICNNMLLGIGMIGTCEAFMLAKRLGLDAQKLFDISSRASGQSWSMTTYCPVPGPVPTSPANRDYQPGFAVDMMLKDLKLAQDAAAKAGASTPLGSTAEALYQLFSNKGHGGLDFSGIIRMIDGDL